MTQKEFQAVFREQVRQCEGLLIQKAKEYTGDNPYRTEVQLYKSLLALKRSIDRDCIVTSQREALQMLRCVISNLEYRFYKAYNMEFEDKRTVYSECAFRLIPRVDEPSVCLLHDWIYLPTA